MNMEWFGTLPTHGNWQAVRLKRLVKWLSLKREYEEGETYIGLENIEPWTGRIIPSDDGTLTLTTSEEITSIGAFFKAGDVLFSKLRPYLAKAFLAESDGLCSTELLVLQPGPDIYGRFLLYVLLTPGFIDLVNSSAFGSKMPRAEWDFIGDVPIPLPPLRQQQQLVALLDRETARLDQLEAAKQTQLALIAEKRRALITRAVTQGLNAAAPRRATGLPWLEDVPVGWVVVPIKRRCNGIKTGSTPKDLENMVLDDDAPTVDWFTPGDFSATLELSNSNRRLPATLLAKDELSWFPAFSVLIVGIGATLGKVGLLKNPASANQQINALMPHDEVVPKFLAYQLQAQQEVLMLHANLATIPILNQQRMGEIEMVFPPLAEQHTIVAYIETETAKLDSLREITETSLALMQERRAALITAAVTGELDTTTA